MKLIFGLLLSCAFALLVTAAETSKPHLFEMHLVLNEATPDSRPMTLLRQNKDGQSISSILNLADRALLDESAIQAAQLQSDPITSRPQVAISLTQKGRKAFAELTRTNLNRQLAILIEGKVLSAPVIKTEILDGKAVIDGNFSDEEARDLANRINKAVRGDQKNKTKP